MTKNEMIAWIDKSSYEALLLKWRFSRSGDPMFKGEVGQYYSNVMFKKRDALPLGEAANISKRIGWERP
jgi:hypothetical protein